MYAAVFSRQLTSQYVPFGFLFASRLRLKLSGVHQNAQQKKIQQALGPHEDLQTIVKKRKLQWYGHVSRSSGLTKNILQGTVKGEEDKPPARGSGEKTSSGKGQAWSSPSPRGQWKTGKYGGNWLLNHLWCPNDRCG